MRILGIDLGTRFVGVAVWDDPELPARPLETITVTEANMIDRIVAVVEREAADELVVGLPLRLDGSDGSAARAARKVAKQLSGRTKLRVSLEDERLTTVQADRHRKLADGPGRTRVDARAAAIVLQTHVDRMRLGWPKGEREG